jgi:hypothetical protein
MAAAGTVCAVGCRSAQAKQAQAKILFGLCAGPEKAEKLKEIASISSKAESQILETLMARTRISPQLANSAPVPCDPVVQRIHSEQFKLTDRPRPRGRDRLRPKGLCNGPDEIGPLLILLAAGAPASSRRFSTSEKAKRNSSTSAETRRPLEKRSVTIVLEPLNKEKPTCLNSVDEGVGYVTPSVPPHRLLPLDHDDAYQEVRIRFAKPRAAPPTPHRELEKRMAPGTKARTSPLSARFEDIATSRSLLDCGWPKETSRRHGKRRSTRSANRRRPTDRPQREARKSAQKGGLFAII